MYQIIHALEVYFFLKEPSKNRATNKSSMPNIAMNNGPVESSAPVNAGVNTGIKPT